MTSGSLHTLLNDPGRLAALRNTALLDTPSEVAFDRLTRLAIRFTRTPVGWSPSLTLTASFLKVVSACLSLGIPVARHPYRIHSVNIIMWLAYR